MSSVRITPGKLSGLASAPPSKSMSHRLLIGAGLSEGSCTVKNLSYSQDVLATLDCLEALGASYEKKENAVTLRGTGGVFGENAFLDCRESGSTLRFFVPLCLLSSSPSTLKGSGRLMERPMALYESLCETQQLFYKKDGSFLKVQGPLFSGNFVLPGNVSSQFITGLLFALPLCRGDSRIEILPPLESASYLDLTLSALREFGICVERLDPLHYHVAGNQKYLAKDVTVEGDHSNAAFLCALSLLGHDVKVTGITEDSLQGDRVFADYFAALEKGCPTLSIADCPDLGPILIALAAAKNGAILTDTRRLKIKESDRGSAMAEELEKLGVAITVEENRILIPQGKLQAPRVPLDSHNDHRIAMSLAVLLTLVGGEIRGAEAVNKSYPDFFDTLTRLQAKVEHYEA